MPFDQQLTSPSSHSIETTGYEPFDLSLRALRIIASQAHAAATRTSPENETRLYLTESAYKVALQKSIPAHIRQLILYYHQNEEKVNGFVRGLAFAKRLYIHFL
jgi:hypothetical protein